MTETADRIPRRPATGVAAWIIAALLSPVPLASLAQARDVPAAEALEMGTSQAGNYLAALVANSQRDTAAAAAFYRETLRGDPRNTELQERAFVSALAAGQMDDAVALAQQLVQRDASNSLANLTLGVRAIKQGRFITARTLLGKGQPSRARDVTAVLLTAWAHAGSKNPKQALETALTLRDGSFDVFRDYHAGLISDFLGNKAEGARRMEAAYQAEKTTLRLVDAYARHKAAAGDRDAALKAYRDFDKVLPRHPVVTSAIADLESGKALAPLVGNAAEGAAEVLYGLGAAGGRQGDELASMIYLRLSLYLNPANGLALVTLADTYERLKQHQQSIAVYDMIPADSPLRPSADIQIGLSLELMGRTEDASRHLEKLVAERPLDVEAWQALGNVESARKNYQKAADAFDKAIAIVGKPDAAHWSLWYRRGIAFERLKQWPKAEADFKQALELYPDQPMVLNYLGYSWVDQGINLEEAFKMLRRAVELRPNDGYIVDSLGWAHYKLGRYEEALRDLEQAIELRPADPVINDHLGDVYWKVGRKLEAKFQWNHARDLKPEPEDLIRILRKIEYGLEEPANPATAEKPAEPAPVTPAPAAPNNGG